MESAKKIINNIKDFKRVMLKYVERDKVEAMWCEAIQKLDEILKEYKDIPKGVRRHTDSSIFPIAALYLTIKSYDKEVAYYVIEEAMRIKSKKAGKFLRNFTRLPGMKSIFLKMWEMGCHSTFGPKCGFQNIYYPRQKNSCKMDIIKCPYHTYLTQLGCPEIGTLFCKNDEYAYGNLHGISFIRTQTLAGGGAKCDFLLVKDK